MGDKTETDRHLRLRDALQELTQGDGVQRDNLVELLQDKLGELQRCWQVNVNNGAEVARQTVILNLEARVEKLSPRPDRQYHLSPQERQDQYKKIVRVCFNIADEYPELDGMSLMQRQAWLGKDARGSLSIKLKSCQRDLTYALDQIADKILEPDFRPVQIGEIPEDSSVTSDYLLPEDSVEPSDDPPLDEAAFTAAVETIIEITRRRVDQVRENIADYLDQNRARRWGIISAPFIIILPFLIPQIISTIRDTHHPPVNAQFTADAMISTDGKWLTTLYARPGDSATFALTVKDTGKASIEFRAIMLYDGGVLEYVTDSSSVAPTITAPGKRVPDRSDPYGEPYDSQSGPNSRLSSEVETLRPGQQVVLKFEFVVDDHTAGGANSEITSTLYSANASDTQQTYQDASFPVINVDITV